MQLAFGAGALWGNRTDVTGAGIGPDQFAILQDGARGVFIQAAQAENDHLDFFSVFFSILAQVSRSATVRLKTSFSGVESGSTEK